MGCSKCGNDGIQNVALGKNALIHNTGSGNTALGAYAGRANFTGSNNVLIGVTAGDYYTGAESNNILIGNGVTGINGESGALHLGDDSGNISKAYIGGVAGVTVANTAAVLIDTVSNQLGTVVSSKRFKENIQDIGDASDIIYKLRPVKFTWKANPEFGVQTGLIAEEVQQVAPQLVAVDREGLPCAISYHELPVLLLAEIQKLRARIEVLEAR